MGLILILILLDVLLFVFNPFGSTCSFPPKGIYFQYKDLKKKEVENIIYNQNLIQKYGYDSIQYRYRKREENYTFKDIKNIVDFGELLLYLFFTTIISVAFVFVISLITTVTCPLVDYNYSFEIEALQDNMVTSGEFHRGAVTKYGYSGMIDGELKYYFLRHMEHGDKIGHIPASKTYINYNNDEIPNITVYTEMYDNIEPWREKMFFFLDNKDRKNVQYYVITVPENTIELDSAYKIDMK